MAPTVPDTIQHGSANFTKGRPFTVTDHDLTINWGGRGRHGFVCGMCDRYFEVGDRARWVYMSKAPNIFVCSSCDGPDVADRFGRRWREVIAPILRQWGKE